MKRDMRNMMRLAWSHQPEFSAESEVGGKSLQDVEKLAIEQTLVKTGGNKSEAAKILNITRTTLDNKIKKYGIDVTR